MTNQLFFLCKVIVFSTLMAFLIKYGVFNWVLIYPLFSTLLLIFLPTIVMAVILIVRQKKLTYNE